MYTQTENAQNHDPRTKPPYLYCQLSANGYYRKRSFLFKDTNSHDLFAFQSNSVFTSVLNGIPVGGHSLISGRGHLKLKIGFYFAYAFSDTHR